MAALGVRFLDASGAMLRGYGGDLEKVDTIDISGLHPAVAETEFTVMCDVNNPLLGERGCAFTFAAQKGADKDMQQLLEMGMNHYASKIEKAMGVAAKEMPGAGAAGGLGFALMTFLGARLQSGIDTVLDLIHFDDLIQDASLVVTGEGRMDWQSSYGKVPCGVGKTMSKGRGSSCGNCRRDFACYEAIYEFGIQSVITTINGAMDIQQAMKDCESLYLDAAIRLFRTLQCGMKMAK